MHPDELDVVDEAEVACVGVAFVVEEACHLLYVLVVYCLDGELLLGVVGYLSGCAYVLSVGIHDAETGIYADVSVVGR